MMPNGTHDNPLTVPMACSRDMRGSQQADPTMLEQRLIDLTTDAVIVRNADGRVTFWNRGAEALYGWTREEAAGRILHEVLHTQFPIPFEELSLHLSRERHWEGELIHTTRDGSHCVVHSRMVVDQDSQGRTITLETNTDITRRKRAEAALLESEARFRTIAESSPVNIWVTNAAGDVEFINTASRAYCGAAETDAQGNKWRSVLHPDDEAQYVEAWDKAVQERAPFDAKCRVRRVDGQWRWITCRGEPRFSTDREFLGHVGSSLDIHDLVVAQQALQESEARFRRFFELGLIGSAITSPTKGWVDVNDELCKMLGYERSELMQMTWAELTHPDDLPNNVVQFNRILAGEIDSCSMNKRYIRKDGRFLEAAVFVGCLRSADGSVDYFVLLVQDITERQRTEAALMTSEERYRAFISHSMEGIWRFEIEPPIDTALPVDEQIDLAYQRGRVAECNDAISRMYGLSGAEELVGKTLDFVLPASAPEARAYLASMIQAGYRVSDSELKRRDAQGRTVYFSNNMAGIVTDGRWVRVWGIQRDMTERKQAEEALKQSEERYRELAERLEYRVAERTAELEQTHKQLRALATELNLTEQRERKRLATELHDHLAQLLVLVRLKLSQAKRFAGLSQQCANLLSQADEVLTESLSYTRTLVSDLSPPVLYEFGLVPALKWLAERMRQHDLSVTIQVHCEEPLPVTEEHAVLLFQSVRELLMNVAKHAACREAAVHLMQWSHELQIEVRDTGVGFQSSSETKDRSSAGATPKFGLFSIRERMKALGGSFEAESAIGQGTRAKLVLPLPDRSVRPRADSPQADRRRIEPTAHAMPPQERQAVRVLLVDDHAMLRQGLRTVLETYADVEILGEARDGEEALALTERLRPTVVVMDINMPRMSGIEATSRIKAQYPQTFVIGLSVNADGDNVKAMQAAGASSLLTKEAAVEQLHTTILQAIQANKTAL